MIKYQKNLVPSVEVESAVLITSIARKVPLLRNVKFAAGKLGGNVRVLGGDIDNSCIGRYFVDGFWEMPRIADLSIGMVVEYCKREDINAIIPTRGGELLFWSLIKHKLADNGIHVMVSDVNTVNSCLDKLLFFKTSKELGYYAIPAYDFGSIEKAGGSSGIVVKERFGAGAKSIGIGLSYDDAVKYGDGLDEPIFQPFIKGDEASIDLYVSSENEVKGVILRWRNLIIDGESQVTTTFRNEKLEDMCGRFAIDFKLYGHAIMQVIIDKDGSFHIVECNCRFGGASTASLSAGLDSFYWFLLEANGVDLEEYPFKRMKHELTQIRCSEDVLIQT
jgi:carbamoyl-phosphate synthase large subunit